MNTSLRLLTGSLAGQIFTIPDNGTLSAGRDPHCGLVLDGANVSRVHARFTCNAGVLTLENLSTTNAVYVNGSRRESAELARWDTVVIGPNVLRVEMAEAPVAAAAPTAAAPPTPPAVR